MRGIEQIPWAYDLLVGLFELAGLSSWRQWLVAGSVGRSLDLGCGTGRSLPLYPAGRRPIGLDPEICLLLRARKRGASVPLVLGRAEALPFASSAFETVAVSLVFCSVADPPKGLAEIRRVLTPTGALRMMEHVRPEGVSGRLADFIQPTWTCLAGGCHPNRRTEEAVTRAGFAIDPTTRRTTRTLRRFVARP